MLPHLSAAAARITRANGNPETMLLSARRESMACSWYGPTERDDGHGRLTSVPCGPGPLLVILVLLQNEHELVARQIFEVNRMATKNESRLVHIAAQALGVRTFLGRCARSRNSEAMALKSLTDGRSKLVLACVLGRPNQTARAAHVSRLDMWDQKKQIMLVTKHPPARLENPLLFKFEDFAGSAPPTTQKDTGVSTEDTAT